MANNKLIPVELKHERSDLAGFNVFMRKSGIKKGYMVSRDIEETRRVNGREISIVPAYKYLLTRLERAMLSKTCSRLESLRSHPSPSACSRSRRSPIT